MKQQTLREILGAELGSDDQGDLCVIREAKMNQRLCLVNAIKLIERSGIETEQLQVVLALREGK